MEMHTQSLVARHNNLHSIGIHEYINIQNIFRDFSIVVLIFNLKMVRKAIVYDNFTYIIHKQANYVNKKEYPEIWG